MIDFKGAHYPKDVSLYAVFFYVRYAEKWLGLSEQFGAVFQVALPLG